MLCFQVDGDDAAGLRPRVSKAGHLETRSGAGGYRPRVARAGGGRFAAVQSVMQGQARQGDIRMHGSVPRTARPAAAGGSRRPAARGPGAAARAGRGGSRTRSSRPRCARARGHRRPAPARIGRPGPLGQRHHARRRQVFDAGARRAFSPHSWPCRPLMRARPSADRRAIAARRSPAAPRAPSDRWRRWRSCPAGRTRRRGGSRRNRPSNSPAPADPWHTPGRSTGWRRSPAPRRSRRWPGGRPRLPCPSPRHCSRHRPGSRTVEGRIRQRQRRALHCQRALVLRRARSLPRWRRRTSAPSLPSRRRPGRGAPGSRGSVRRKSACSWPTSVQPRSRIRCRQRGEPSQAPSGTSSPPVCTARSGTPASRYSAATWADHGVDEAVDRRQRDADHVVAPHLHRFVDSMRPPDRSAGSARRPRCRLARAGGRGARASPARRRAHGPAC
jgi:hypothetical protein